MRSLLWAMIAIIFLTSCEEQQKPAAAEKSENPYQKLMEKYVEVPLTADITHLSDNEKEMLKLLFQAADLMDEVFWLENAGPKEEILAGYEDPYLKKYVSINYGPWDELEGLKPIVAAAGPKAPGAEFYPKNMTKEEFEAFDDPYKKSLYTLIRRDENGALTSVWYHDAFAEQHSKAADLLDEAAELAGDAEFANYLKLRAEALRTDDYFASDMAWLDVKNNHVDLVIGPIENYTDALFGYKAAHESFILIKDMLWSERLQKYAAFLPQLQEELPVDPKYKQDKPGSDADLNAYDVIYYAGDCNMAGKTIAINLPNDEKVQLQKGTRKLQLKNAMKAKFDHIMLPITKALITPEQQKYVTFDAFFSNTMFHEVAHGMGIKNTITGKGVVRQALKEQYSAIEEGKADILGLYLVTRLHDMGEFNDTELMDNYVTFMAGIFRSIRFGVSSAHGVANMIRYNFFLEKGAFSRNEDGTYVIDMEKMKEASTALTQKILQVQGDGDYEAAKKWVADSKLISEALRQDLNKLDALGIPRDIYFKQGPQMVGL